MDVWEAGQVTTPPTDAYRVKAASPHAWLESLAWSPDGHKFAFCAVFDAYPAEIVIGSETSGQWQTELMPPPRRDARPRLRVAVEVACVRIGVLPRRA